MTWMQTRSSRKLDYEFPRAADIDLNDIATSLARLPRFLGHTTVAYSVAQHSVHVSYRVPSEPPELRLAALLHDAHEAYLCDLPQPLKEFYRRQLGKLEYDRVFQGLQNALDAAIAERFGFGMPLFHNHQIKAADLRMLATEKAAIMGPSPEPWSPLPPPYPDMKMLVAWDEQTAKKRFIARFWEVVPAIRFRLTWTSSDGVPRQKDFASISDAREFADGLEASGSTSIDFEEIVPERPAAE